MPLMHTIGALGGDSAILFPATKAIADMAPAELWSNYVRYIGAGAVACGGILSLIKSLPLIIRTFKKALGGLGHKGGDFRTEKDLSIKWAMVVDRFSCTCTCIDSISTYQHYRCNHHYHFGFFFATVSSRMVGLVCSLQPCIRNGYCNTSIATMFLGKQKTGIHGIDNGYSVQVLLFCH